MVGAPRSRGTCVGNQRGNGTWCESSRPMDTYKAFRLCGRNRSDPARNRQVVGVASRSKCRTSPQARARRGARATSSVQAWKDEVEVLGGGTFGVVDDVGAGPVCKQEPSAGATIGEVPRLTVDRECGDGGAFGEQRRVHKPEEDTNPEPAESGSGDQGDQTTEREVRDASPGRAEPAGCAGSTAIARQLLAHLDRWNWDESVCQMLDSGWKVCGSTGRAQVRGCSVDRMVELIAVKLHEPCQYWSPATVPVGAPVEERRQDERVVKRCAA